MNTKLFLLIVLFVQVAVAEESATTPPQRSAFFDRLFGPNAQPAATVVGQNGPAPEVEKTWTLFAPGSLPAGKKVDHLQALSLEPGSYRDKTIYLTGNFVVTASGAGRTVLRPAADGSVGRIIVEYTNTVVPPPEATKITLDASRALLIRDIRRSADGQVNIYTREIVGP